MTIQEKFETEIRVFDKFVHGVEQNYALHNLEETEKEWADLLNEPIFDNSVRKYDDTQELVLADRILLCNAQLDYDDTINLVCRGAWNEIGLMLRRYILHDLLKAMAEKDRAKAENISEAIRLGCNDLACSLLSEWKDIDDNLIDLGDKATAEEYESVGRYVQERILLHVNSGKDKEENRKTITSWEELCKAMKKEDCIQLEEWLNKNIVFRGRLILECVGNNVSIYGLDESGCELTAESRNYPMSADDFEAMIDTLEQNMLDMEKEVELSGSKDYTDLEMKMDAIHHALRIVEDQLTEELRKGYGDGYDIFRNGACELWNPIGDLVRKEYQAMKEGKNNE